MTTDFKTTKELLTEFKELKLENKTLKTMYEQLLKAHKRTEELLYDRGDLFRIISDLTTDYIFIFKITDDGQINFDLALGALEKITGYTFEEFKTISFWRSTVHPDDLEKGKLNFRKLLNNENITSEIRTIHKNGNIVWVNIYAHPIWDEKANKLSGIAGAVKDISDRKKAEELLREREQYIEILFNLNPDIVYIYDLIEQQTVYFNIGTHNSLGYTIGEIQEMGNQLLPILMHPEDYKIYLEKIYRRYLKLRDNEITNRQFRIKHRNGDWNWADCNTIVYKRDNDGNPLQIFGVIHEINKLIRAEEEVKLKNDQLRILNSEKDKFFSILAHNLRSPFQGFLSLTQILAEDATILSAPELAKLSANMNREAKNLFNLLKNLLDWAKIQNDTMSFRPEYLSLSNVISESVKDLNTIALRKGVKINNTVTSPVYAYFDRKMINSVIMNLLFNAIKFTHGNGTVTVKVKKTVGEMIEISVSDTGIGMIQSLIEKLFKLGEKTGRKGTEGELGTGLGLFLCREFIEKHGSKIWVESQENIGSTFYFTLQHTDKLNT